MLDFVAFLIVQRQQNLKDTERTQKAVKNGMETLKKRSRRAISPKGSTFAGALWAVWAGPKALNGKKGFKKNR